MTPTNDTALAADLPRTETSEAAQALCKRLFETSVELVDVLDRETALLKQGKPSQTAAIHVRKVALNAMLTRDMQAFRRDAEFIKMAAPDEISALKEQHGQLEKSINANQDALIAMKAVSESLLHTIAAKATARISGPEVYGKKAEVSASTPSRPAAISVNTIL